MCQLLDFAFLKIHMYTQKLSEEVQEILVTQDHQEVRDSLDHQATQEIQEDQEDQVISS